MGYLFMLVVLVFVRMIIVIKKVETGGLPVNVQTVAQSVHKVLDIGFTGLSHNINIFNLLIYLNYFLRFYNHKNVIEKLIVYNA